MRVVRSLESRMDAIMSVLGHVASSGSYSEGVYCTKVRAQIEEITGRYPVMANSCGSALYLVFKYLRECEEHTEALVQNNTFYASGASALEAGIKVHLVDSRDDCPSMSVDSLIEAHKFTRANVVVLTHVAGWLAKDYERIYQYCQIHKLVLVEDCAHAFGVTGAGGLGDYACFSFYPTKAVPCGEGGAVTSQNREFLKWADRFVKYGKYVENGVMKYDRGMNLRMSEWDAAVLSVQLEHLPEILAARREDARALQSIAPCMLEGESNYYKYPVKKEHAFGLKRVGKVYAESDQLLHSLKAYASGDLVGTPVSLVNSVVWAYGHDCLPCGEGLYKALSVNEIRNLLDDRNAS